MPVWVVYDYLPGADKIQAAVFGTRKEALHWVAVTVRDNPTTKQVKKSPWALVDGEVTINKESAYYGGRA